MARNGYRVMVLTSKIQAGQNDRDANPGVDVLRVPASHILERRFFIPFPLFSPRLVIDAWRLLRQADVVHIHDVFYMCSWVAALIAAAMRKPVFLTQHVALVEHSSKLVMWMQRLVYATFGRLIFRKAALVVAYNANVRDFLIARGVPEQRILFLANGINTSKFRPPAPGERRAVCRQTG
jgi:D-inositol-3-phosphate glycosyltransferase